jgi:cytochrome c551/c552
MGTEFDLHQGSRRTPAYTDGVVQGRCVFRLDKEQVMKTSVLVFASLALLGSGSVLAQSDVLKQKGCVNCHAPDTKKVGPSMKDLQAKHKGVASDEVVAKLKNGKGHPKVSGSDAEIKAAVEAIVK